jgi:hypothetical protein
MMMTHCEASLTGMHGFDDNEGESYGIRGQPTHLGNPTAALHTG